MPIPALPTRLRLFVPVALATVLLLASGAAHAAEEVRAGHRSDAGLEIVDFTLPGVAIQIFLPQGPAAGEVISGRLGAAPIADGGRSRRVAKRLRQLTVEVGGATWSPVPGETHVLRSVEVCADLACVADGGGRAVPVRLLDAKGRTLAEALVPVFETAAPAPRGFTARTVAVVGESVVLDGPFDGDAATTRLTVHGEAATVLAESPRGAVVRVPPTAVGPGQQVLEEGSDGRRYRFPFRGLAVRLAAGKPALQSGERTLVQLQIQGLADLITPLTVQLVSRQPRHAVLAAGPVEALEIHPTEIQAGGVYQWVGTAVGVSPGPLELALSAHHAAEPVGPFPESDPGAEP